MTDNQPEALRLADLMLEKPDSDGHCMKAAAELRRLHALCDEMGDALEAADEQLMLEGLNPDGPTRNLVIAALAKWKESK